MAMRADGFEELYAAYHEDAATHCKVHSDAGGGPVFGI